MPQFVQDIRAMDGHIGISHYVSGNAESGEAEGRNGPIITELIADPLNTVDFVTVPGAGGHYRTLGEAMTARKMQDVSTGPENKAGHKIKGTERRKRMGDNQESLTLAEIRTNHPEVVAELKDQLAKELKEEAMSTETKQKIEEAADRAKAVEAENKELKAKIAGHKAREYVATEMTKAKLPEASSKILTEALVKQVVLTEDGAVDADTFASIVGTAIKAKMEEIAEIRKEAGIKGNGGTAPAAEDGKKALFDSFVSSYQAMGKTKEDAEKLAEIAAGGR
jgi:hypothetical protein